MICPYPFNMNLHDAMHEIYSRKYWQGIRYGRFVGCRARSRWSGWLVQFQQDHFFPSSLMACIALSISAIPQWTPTQGPHAHSARWQVTCWNETSVEKNTFESPSNNFPFFQANDWSHKPHLWMVWLLTLASDWKAKTRRNGELDIHACRTLSSGFEKLRFGPKMVSETTSHPLNSRDSLGGACPHTPIYTSPGHFKYDGYCVEVYISAVFLSYCH